MIGAIYAVVTDSGCLKIVRRCRRRGFPNVQQVTIARLGSVRHMTPGQVSLTVKTISDALANVIPTRPRDALVFEKDRAAGEFPTEPGEGDMLGCPLGPPSSGAQ